VKLAQGDYLLLRLASSAGGVLQSLGELESAALRRRTDGIPIVAPVFLTGLARSGTTILLEELSKVPGVGTHQYRDFPFLMTPWIWNRFLDIFRAARPPVERPHKDRIRITAESPEAFEEPIWQHFFPHLHSDAALHRLAGDRRSAEFECFFSDHIRKILLIRGRQRYLSKENYNVVRMEYLATVFPDARFIVPIRHPFTHVDSLVRQHVLFCSYASHDARIPRYLAAAGHYEFGPQRVPIRLSHEAGDRIRAAWERGEDAAGYASQWAEIYRFVDQLCSAANDLSRRIFVVRYEDFCARPHDVMRGVLQHARLDPGEAIAEHSLDHIALPQRGAADLPEEFRAQVWRETECVAERFGYNSTGTVTATPIRRAA
jgi:hypothetical protein